ncbi:MAG: hypothetical protein PHX25_01945 [Candidatus Pacebacteria bacterium]|nr:hypothetical protein [Candidatus Paceibacterota bacterium]
MASYSRLISLLKSKITITWPMIADAINAIHAVTITTIVITPEHLCRTSLG